MDEAKLLVEGYSDCDGTGNKKSQKLISGFILMITNGPVC